LSGVEADVEFVGCESTPLSLTSAGVRGLTSAGSGIGTAAVIELFVSLAAIAAGEAIKTMASAVPVSRLSKRIPMMWIPSGLQRKRTMNIITGSP
jgi:hypothetical protein